MAELAERLAFTHGHEVHLYCQRVEDVQLSQVLEGNAQGGGIHWRKVAVVPGPHVLRFLGWYFLNRRARQKDSAKSGLYFDAVFSPGINCSDADVILVHAVFHRLAELQAQFGGGGLRGLHRRLYYWLLCRLERKIYTDRRAALAAVSKHTAEQLARYFGREDVSVFPNGVDIGVFHPIARESQRKSARLRWNFADSDVVVLLIGNDWRNKGLGTLLEAAAKCSDLPMRLLVVGGDNPLSWRAAISRLGLSQRVTFVPPSSNVLDFYAAADILAAPSLEDSFNLPALEAMACGLPIIASVSAGISSLLRHGTDSFILENPQDSTVLSSILKQLCLEKDTRLSIGKCAAQTATRFTWDNSVNELIKFMEDAVRKKYNPSAPRPHS